MKLARKNRETHKSAGRAVSTFNGSLSWWRCLASIRELIPMGVRENRSKSGGDPSAMLSSHSLDVHLFPTKNGPGPGQPKYSDRESGTLTSRRIVCDHDHWAFLFSLFLDALQSETDRSTQPHTATIPSIQYHRSERFGPSNARIIDSRLNSSVIVPYVDSVHSRNAPRV